MTNRKLHLLAFALSIAIKTNDHELLYVRIFREFRRISQIWRH